MSGDIFVTTWKNATSISWIKVRDAAKHPAIDVIDP
jgi:hypothetical protein